MRKYELMYVVRPDLTEEETQAVVAYYADILVKNGATITKTDEWGLRDLAYPIQKQTKGYYVVLNVESGNDAMNEFNRLARINEKTLRYIAIKED